MDRGGILPQCERLVSLQSRIQHPVGVKEGRAEEIAGGTVLPTTIQIDTGKRPSVYRLRRILPRSQWAIGGVPVYWHPLWLQPDLVVNGLAQSLLAPQVPLGRLD